MWSTLFVLNAGLVISIAWMALAGWNNGTLTVPRAVATAVPFALQIMNMSGWILEIGSTIFRQIGTVRDSMETIAQPITLLDAPDAQPLKVNKGEIVFDDVTFNYWRGKSGTVIEDFNLAHRAGREGRPGRALGRRQVDAGQPRAAPVRRRERRDPHRRPGRHDGDAGEPARGHWPRQPGHLAAAPLGAARTSSIGRQTRPTRQMIAAAEQAHVAEVIAGLVDPEAAPAATTRMSASGASSSRAASASAWRSRRVLLKDAPILDARRGDLGARLRGRGGDPGAAATLMQGKTVIAIAHRLSTIAAMDRLVVLEGQIVEEGTHAQLLAAGGHYAPLWERQSGGFLDLDAKAAE